MTVKQFIMAVADCSAGNYKRNGLSSEQWEQWGDSFEKIAEHYKACRNCSLLFDSYVPFRNASNLSQVVKNFMVEPTEINNWVCYLENWT